jgi:molecular chaperone DnaK (HSP70)
MNDLVVGIDLGTTNSEVAAFADGRVRVLGPNQSKMLPSCVGIAPSGELLVGEGDFRIEGLKRTEGVNEVLCRMSLDLDGILHVSAIEKETGKSKQITIANALLARSEAEIAAARQRIEELYTTREDIFDQPEDDAGEAAEAEPVEVQRTNGKAVALDAAKMDEGWAGLRHEAADLVQRARVLHGRMHAEDRDEAVALQQAIESAVNQRDSHALAEALRSLKELLFFVEGA